MSPLLLLLLAPYPIADMNSAARDLARTLDAAVAHEPVALTVKNLSALDSAEIRRVLESELKAAAQPTAEVQLTISENLTEFLLVAEIRRNGERQVLLESWPRLPAAPAAAPEDSRTRVTLEKKLLWEQDLPILDVAQTPAAQTAAALLVLDATRVLLVRGADRQSVPIPSTHPWPRDPRGRLLVSDTAFTAYLPGTICRGSTQPQLSLACQDSPEPWLLAPGALALFAPDRNLFLGHIDIAPGGPRDLPPFYSAAPAGDAWIFAATDGRAHVYTAAALEAAGTIDHWGSDIAAIQTACGARILATRPAAPGDPDAIQPYELVNNAPNPAGPALEFPGPVTALWSAGNTATAVSRDLQTGRYAAFSLAPTCGS
ncbi:MAG: hypothetical protein ABSF64_21455 [Bryobacteraceae bacterium]